MSSHIISEVEQTADRVAVLREGRLVALATVAELRARSLRQVEVEVVGDTSAEQLAEDLALVEAGRVPALNGGVRVSGSFPGEPADLLRRLSGAAWRDRVDDLVVAAPDLEDAVLRFYAPESPAGATTGAGPREEVPA